MKQFDEEFKEERVIELEKSILSCILLKPKLLRELYVDEKVFRGRLNILLLRLFKSVYEENDKLDITTLFDSNNVPERIPTAKLAKELLEYTIEVMNTEPTTANFYYYQELLIDSNRDYLIKLEIENYSRNKLSVDQLIEKINEIQNSTMIVKQSNKVTPDEMISIIRDKEKIIIFPRLWALNQKLQIKKKTVNVIGARPSEGKSALALNLFCDLSKEYKCIYFNMEMTEAEVYERMLGIESDIAIKYIVTPETEHQDNCIRETANKIYNYKYEVVNGSKTIDSIRKKVIKEQRDEHLIIFIDYVGYIVGKQGMSDKDRIGEAVRDLNNMTKDYDCTVFLVAQINRNGTDLPTMQDLKDSGEIEQTADTIILIHDENKEDLSVEKEIGFLIPKCRGGRRNIRIPVIYNKEKQRMSVK